MSQSSSGFNLLHEGVRRWVWKQGWDTLRDIQELAIEPILRADCDVIISATTAAGKTEAAFLPACSKLATNPSSGVGILYISPLKALINDQYRRLQSLCDILGFPVTPWHGDVLQSIKDKQIKNPSGILLITPESLESLLINSSPWCIKSLSNLQYIIIDEFHAFIGTERGCQLQSLMHRIEFLVKKKIPRIALSATLGDMELVASNLRKGSTLPEIIVSTTATSDLQVQLRGYSTKPQDKDYELAIDIITQDLFKILRGKSNLVFANSRNLTEKISANLSDYCEKDVVPNEFFPHHGNLSKEFRETLEARLQKEAYPTTAICTMTLELGIDIGCVDSIAQITSPHSVSSLRQRLGRSGRRGDPAILRIFIEEQELTEKSHLGDRLRVDIFNCVAMVSLLLKKWYEPPGNQNFHLSTLLQQTLSVIAQYGGVRANQLWSLLCETGAFNLIEQSLYGEFLSALGKNELITQTHDGQIVLGVKGEKLVAHFSFYSVFKTFDEYRLECNGKILGAIPIDIPLILGQMIIFAGKRWEVLNVFPEKKLILLKKSKGGNPPVFNSTPPMVHDVVRKEMFNTYLSGVLPNPNYLDKHAKLLFEEGVECFHVLGLDKKKMIQIGNTVHILPWVGGRIINTLIALLRNEGLRADSFSVGIDVSGTSIETVKSVLKELSERPAPTSIDLASKVMDTIVDKYDNFIPENLRQISYGNKYYDVDSTMKLISELVLE